MLLSWPPLCTNNLSIYSSPGHPNTPNLEVMTPQDVERWIRDMINRIEKTFTRCKITFIYQISEIFFAVRGQC